MMGCTGGWEVAQAVCVGGVQRRCTLMTLHTDDSGDTRHKRTPNMDMDIIRGQ